MTINSVTREILRPFLQDWALPTREARMKKRMGSSVEEMRRFYNAVAPHLENIIEYLNRYPLESIPENDKELAYAALMMCEIDNPVNKWKAPLLEDALDPTELVYKKDFYDMEITREMGWESFGGGRFSYSPPSSTRRFE